MNDSSLIPRDYVNERREIRRTSLGVLLFLVVMGGVVAAFLVTNRQWESVRVRQRAVAAEFAEVSEKITHMEELKVARDDLVRRAELAAALVSRVPRSILIDGLVERMPPRLSWTRLTLESEEYRPPVPRDDPSADRLRPRGPAPAPVRNRGRALADGPPVPRTYVTTITLSGLAPDEVDVSTYVAALAGFPLLGSVMPDSTQVVVMDELQTREFTITMELDRDAIVDGRFEDRPPEHAAIPDPDASLRADGAR